MSAPLELLRRWRTADPEARTLFIEAAATLTLAQLATRLLPFRWIARYACRPMAFTQQSDVGEQISLAIRRAVRHHPLTLPCLAQALAAQAMSRRRNVSVRLEIGVGRDAHGTLIAHAWSVAGDQILTGAREATRVSLIKTLDNQPAPSTLTLVAHCCCRPMSTEMAAAIRATTQATDFDWARFLRVAERQRVVSLSWQGLQLAGVTPPVAIVDKLKARAQADAMAGLRLSASALQAAAALETKGIPCAMLKGPALAHALFGSVAVRRSKDLDLLVRPEDFDRAAETLIAAGYTRTTPAAQLQSPALLSRYRALRKDFGFTNATQTVQIELHHRLTDSPSLLPTPPSERWIDGSLGEGRTIRTLAPDDHLLYLCVHGAGHAWMRLKWLVDVAVLINRMPPDDLVTFVQRSRSLGLDRCVGSALLLAAQWFTCPLEPALKRSLSADPNTQRLCRTANRLLTAGDGATELERQPFGTTRVMLTQFLLHRSWRYKLATLETLLLHDADYATIALPTAMHRLYPLLRLPLWLLRKLRDRGRSPERRR